MKSLILAIGLGGLTLSSFSQTYLDFSSQKVYRSPEKKSLSTPSKVVSQAQDDVTVSYTIGNAILDSIVHENYSLLRIKGFGMRRDVGKPSLPAYTDILAVPHSTGLSVEITEAVYTEFENYTIYPAQEPVIDSKVSAQTFTKDSALYATNALYPAELASICDIQEYRGTYLARVTVSPVQYNPVTKKLRCYSRISYKLSYAVSGRKATSVLQIDSASYKLLNNIITNTAFLSAIPIVETDSNKYIIVTTNKFLPAVNEYAAWKKRTGFHTTVLSKNSWSSSEVKQALSTLYRQAASKPKYLLIVGGHEDVPGEWSTTNHYDHVTDLYYVCFGGNGDYTADMGRGRIPVKTQEEARNVFSKIINYEKSPPMDEPFYRTGTNSTYFETADGTTELRRFVLTTENIRDYLSAKGYTVHRVYYTEDQNTPQAYENWVYGVGQDFPEDLLKPAFDWKGDSIDIKEKINTGSFYVLHRGHGDPTEWIDPKFNNDNVSDLRNGNKTPVVFSINCETGSFNLDVCLAEKLLKHPIGGAVGVIGASQISYSGHNDAFAIGLFDAIWSNPGLTGEYGLWGVQNPNINPHSDIYAMGDVLNQALLRMGQTWVGDIRHSSTYTLFTNEIFHYFGDPGMEIRTVKPMIFEDVSIQENNTSVRVDTGGTEGCRITLCSQDDQEESYFAVANNASSHTFENVPSSYSICISKSNYIPYLYYNNLYIQNKTISTEEQYTGGNIYVGKNVSPSVPEGEVNIVEGGKLILKATKDVLIDKGVSVEKGGILEIK